MRVPIRRQPRSPWVLSALFIGLALGLHSACLAVTVTHPIVGDMDGDGRVTVADAAREIQLAVGLETASPADLAAGDVSPSPGTGPRAGMPLGDGVININDVLVLLRHTVGLPGGPWADPANPASFARIHKTIFLRSCATSSCHNANAQRADLNLEDPIQAYALLVNHDPTNAAAVAQAMKRVVPGSPDSSYLMTKLNGPATDDLGVKMPYGTDGLPADQVALVRQWIASGAPFDVDDGSIPTDTGAPAVDPKAVDVTLPAPPPDQGFQITVGPFDVPAGQEIQRDYFLKTPNVEGRWIKRIEYSYNKGSHHLLVFKSDTEDVPDHVETFFGINLSFNWRLILGAQNEAVTSDFPPGIAVYLAPHQQMDFQLHYVNTATQSTPTGHGKLVMNFWYTDANQVTARAGFLLGTKVGFSLPPHQETTLSRSFAFPKDTNVFALGGHFHSRGRQFRIYRWDGHSTGHGELVYESKEWDDPKYQPYDPPLLVKAGTGFTFEATYDNNTDHPILYGPHAETEEHLFYFVWFYRDNDLTPQDLLDIGL